MISLDLLPKLKGSRRRGKRLGQGFGSGKGAKAGRGDKGQKAREGHKIKLSFQGGQLSFSKGIGWKRGVKNPANNPKAHKKRTRFKSK